MGWFRGYACTVYHVFLIFVLLLNLQTIGNAADITLQWDANTEPDLTGYKIYYDVDSGHPYNGSDATYYNGKEWVKSESPINIPVNILPDPKHPEVTLKGFENTRQYFFAVTAYDNETLESDYSNEVSAELSIPETYTIVSVIPSNGSISPEGSLAINHGENMIFTISPDDGYEVSDVMVDNQSVGKLQTYMFENVTSDHEITAYFTKIADGGSEEGDPDTGSGTDSGTDSTGGGTTIGDSVGNPNDGNNNNQPPVADAGPDQEVSMGLEITLNGENSTDPDGDIESYQWEQTEGIGVVIVESVSARTTFIAPDVSPEGETLKFQLTVTDKTGFQSKDVTIVNVIWENEPPVANAGEGQTVDEGTDVTLDGGGSVDIDDGIVSFTWKQIEGSPVAILNPEAAVTTFKAPDVGPDGETLKFQLITTDQGGLQSQDIITINVSWKNEPPVAQAGDDQDAVEGETVILNGENSSDNDDGIVTYRWSQIEGSPVTFSNPASYRTTFTAPDVGPDGETLKFILTVIDNGKLESSDSCDIYVSFANIAPTANAGDDQSVYEKAQVTLSGYGSIDPDDGIASFKWQQTGGKSVLLSGDTTVSPTFTAPEIETDSNTLTFSLTITDNHGLTHTDICRIIVNKAVKEEMDKISPILQIVSPTKNSSYFTGNSTISLTGDASDNVGIKCVMWENSNGTGGIASGTEKWSVGNIRLTKWKNTITITAIDYAGNRNSTILRVYYFPWW